MRVVIAAMTYTSLLLSPLAFAQKPEANHLWASSSLGSQHFASIAQRLVDIFSPLTQAKNKELHLTILGELDHFQAAVQQRGDIYSLVIYGGLLQHPMMDEETLVLTICHELGHFFGGEPRYLNFPVFTWAAVEGQADYFATAFCAKAYYHRWPKTPATPSAKVQKLCRQQTASLADEQLCWHNLQGIKNLGQLVASITKTPVPEFSTPATNQVGITLESYPSLQCRFDTWVAGALCDQDVVGLPLENLEDAYCHTGIGRRPSCWFVP